MPEVLIEDLVKEFGDVRASDGVDLQIKDGEFVTLLGPSGCGKTTLLRCIAGLETPDSGRLTLGGRVAADPAAKLFIPPEKRQLGMVFQSYALWPHMSVRGNVSYPLRVARAPRSEVNERVASLIKVVGLEGLRDRMPSELSGGQQQRVALARALATGSDLVLFDEPLSNLDAGMRITMREEIRSIHRTMGTTSILVTHDQEEALALSDRVVLMSKGSVIQIGTPREVYASPRNEFVAQFFGFENIYSATMGKGAERTLVLDGGSAAIPVPDGYRLDDTTTGVAIKASHVRIGAAVRAEDGLVLSGRVRTRSYVGDRTEFVVEAGALEVRAVVLNHLTGGHPLPDVGEITQVQFPAELLAPLGP